MSIVLQKRFRQHALSQKDSDGISRCSLRFRQSIFRRGFLFSPKVSSDSEFFFLNLKTLVSVSNTATASNFTITSTHSCERHHWPNRIGHEPFTYKTSDSEFLQNRH